jgi:hypothetical protein
LERSVKDHLLGLLPDINLLASGSFDNISSAPPQFGLPLCSIFWRVPKEDDMEIFSIKRPLLMRVGLASLGIGGATVMVVSEVRSGFR